ncbi:hypothetical protein ADUPG1_012138 [Aduncisulcus paluster]|uniref:Uncharacterized protein n=1 Tax=Aduncisulcus paluster TaxID=2918883 RepID=A0ABQ5K389_9EUKA|nr:hypothetical protein ADUPG1_012138 [Aduncisulcus paluster]
MNKNIIKIYEGTKRRFSGLQEKFEKSLPPLISGEATVTSANLEMFLDTSKIYFGQLDKIAKRIAVRLLSALCLQEYTDKEVKTNRRLKDVTRKKIIFEEIRSDVKFTRLIERYTDSMLYEFYSKYLSTSTNNNLSNVKKSRTTMFSMVAECEEELDRRHIDISILQHYRPGTWSTIVQEQSIVLTTSDRGTASIVLSQNEVPDEEEEESSALEEIE